MNITAHGGGGRALPQLVPVDPDLRSVSSSRGKVYELLRDRLIALEPAHGAAIGERVPNVSARPRRRSSLRRLADHRLVDVLPVARVFADRVDLGDPRAISAVRVDLASRAGHQATQRARLHHIAAVGELLAELWSVRVRSARVRRRCPTPDPRRAVRRQQTSLEEP